MVDKKIVWNVGSLMNGADQLYDNKVIELLENAFQTKMVAKSVSGSLEIFPAGLSSKVFYIIIGVTDPTGGYPFNAATLNAITTDQELQTFLDNNRDFIWMTLGGLATYDDGGTFPDERKFEFDAKSQRALMAGQKVVLALFARDYTGTAVSNSIFSVDMTVFYE